MALVAGPRNTDVELSMLTASITLHTWQIAFETECRDAFAAMAACGPYIFERFAYTFLPGSAGAVTPVLCYVDSELCHLGYDATTARLTLKAPWSRVEGSTSLLMSAWLLTELLRQREGTYLLHASAVARGSACLVLSGAAGSGKTTTALHLCLKHGFGLIANDQVLLGYRDGAPTILWGDSRLNLRFASTAAYSSTVSARMFGEEVVGKDAWRRKRRATPEALGIEALSAPRVVTRFVFLSLDAALDVVQITELGGDDGDAVLLGKIALHTEMTNLIKGAGFTPLGGDMQTIDLLVPSLDEAVHVVPRHRFLDGLFKSARPVVVRGGLEALTEWLVESSAFGTPS